MKPRDIEARGVEVQEIHDDNELHMWKNLYRAMDKEQLLKEEVKLKQEQKNTEQGQLASGKPGAETIDLEKDQLTTALEFENFKALKHIVQRLDWLREELAKK